MNRKVKWMIFGGAAALLLFVLFFLTREPPPPFKFLEKYPVVDRRSTSDGSRRFVIVKGNLSEVAKDAEAEIRAFRISSSMSNVNGMMQESRAYGTAEGEVRISTDLSGGAFESSQSFGSNIQGESRDGYCAISYTRPKSLMDKALDWVRGLFGDKEQPQPQGVMVESATTLR